MMQNRTHTCGELRLSDAGKQVKISGWMENVRVVSANLAFVVVRDFYGTTQVVAETEDMVNTFKAITKESTISVEGIVRERDSKTNKMATGDIEIVPAKVEVLGRCQHAELPFQINRSRDADEALRLKYRYLDLRNPAVKKNIILRCNVVAALRQAMTAEGFMEITTPILTASSPEGARDYLVPARKHPGKFYALPQAPQQFKQLLMASGFDRYFQIAPCFRDEDARGDQVRSITPPPTMGDLRSSGQIEQDADIILLMWREDYDLKDAPRIIQVAKNRNGEALDKVRCRFDGEHQTFTRIEPRPEPMPAKKARQKPRQVSFWGDGSDWQQMPDGERTPFDEAPKETPKA